MFYNFYTSDFTYVADQEAIASAQEELANSQVDLINWEQDEINEADQEKLDEKSKYLARVKTIMDNALNGEYESMEEFNRAMTNLNKEYMGDMNLINSTEWNNIFTSTQTNLDNIESAYSTYVTNMEELAVRAKQALQDIIDAQAAEAKAKTDAEEAAWQPDDWDSKNTTQQALWLNNNMTDEEIKNDPNMLKYVVNTVTTVVNADGVITPQEQAQIDEINSRLGLSIGSYADGGVVDYTGLAQVHGQKSSSEVMFNAGQAKKLYELVKGLPEGLDISKIMNNSILKVRNMADIFKPVDIMASIGGILKQTAQTTQQIFNIDRLELPNVNNQNGIDGLIQGLNSYAIQYSKK